MWAIGAADPRGRDVKGHQVRELAVRDLQERWHLVDVYLERHGDHVIAEALVSEPDRHCMHCRQLLNGRGSIHAPDGKEGRPADLQYPVLRFADVVTQMTARALAPRRATLDRSRRA